MKLAIDTVAYSLFCKGESPFVEAIRSSESILFPFVVLGELRAGFRCGTKAIENEKDLQRFLNSARVKVLYADEQTTVHYARIFTQLRQQGTPIPTNDLWIASLTLQHNLALLTNDQHFKRIPQLVLYEG